MFRLATASVLASKLRLALSAVAVVLGVAFVSGTFVLTDSIDAAFGDLLTEVTAGVDAYVSPAAGDQALGDGPPGLDTSGRSTLDESLLDDVLAVDGVAAATGSVEGVAIVVDRDGEPVGGQGPPQLAFSWDEGEGSAVTLREGAAPTGPDEIAIDVTTAGATGYAIGDTVEVLLPDTGVQEFILTAIVGFGEEDNLLGATLTLFDLPTAQDLFGKVGELDQIIVQAAEDVSVADLVVDLDAAVGGDKVEVVSAADQQQQDQREITDGLAFLDVILLSFAGVALFVGAFIILNTFSIIVGQRTREFALLRAVGASTRQVRTVVVLEGLLVGVLGGTAGLVLGIAFSQGLQAVFGAMGTDFPDGGIVIAPRTVVASYAVAIIITLISSLGPARRAARIAPVEALRGTGALDTAHVGRGRTSVGAALALVGGGLIAAGLSGVGASPAALVGGGVAATFVGITLLAPWLARPVTGLFGAVLGGSVVARLARANAARNPGRTSSTASALMIGVALVTFISVLAASITATVGTLFDDQFGADLAIRSQGGFGSVPNAFADEARGLDGVESVATVPLAAGRIDDEQLLLAGVDPTIIDDHLALEASDGALSALADGGILLGRDALEARDLEVGDTVTLTLPAIEAAELEVIGTFTNIDLLGTDWVVSLGTYRATVGEVGQPSSVSLIFADGVDREAVRADVEALASAYPGVAVQDVGEVLAAAEDQVDQVLNVIIALLALALVIAVIGIVNTLALSVLERTREIGLLRAVGMLRAQVRAAIRREAVLVSLFGATLGIALGGGFASALVTASMWDDPGTLALPAGRIAVYFAGAGVAGVLAAVLPARRAARLDVLQAVTAE